MVLPDVKLLHSILSYHRCSVVCVAVVEGKFYAKFMGGWHPVILTGSFGDSTLSLANCILAF